MKRILFVILFLLGCLSFSVFAQQDSKDKIIVYYFHGNARCVSCRKIEQYTKEALEKFFKNEIASQEITFRGVNTEEPGNEHFVNDYQLYTKSVVLSAVSEGKELKHKNLEQVWQHLHNKEKFYEYIQNEIQKYLNNES